MTLEKRAADQAAELLREALYLIRGRKYEHAIASLNESKEFLKTAAKKRGK